MHTAKYMKGKKGKWSTPSSSSRASSLLSEGESSAFTSFLTYGEREDVPSHPPAEFSGIFKKMMKKDTTTKLKAINSFAECLNSASDEDILHSLPSFTLAFNRLASDTDRRVRSEMFSPLPHLISRTKHHFIPTLHLISSSWFICQHDINSEVSLSAKNAWELSFSSHEKRNRALFLCINDVFQSLTSLIRDHKERSGDDREVYSQRTHGVILTLVSLIECANEEQLKDVVVNLKSELPAILRCVSNSVPSIRQAAVRACCVIMEKIPNLLIRGEIVDAVLKSLSDRTPENIPGAMNFTICAIRSGVIVHPELWKKCCRLVSNGGYGNTEDLLKWIIDLVESTENTLLDCSNVDLFLGSVISSLRSPFTPSFHVPNALNTFRKCCVIISKIEDSVGINNTRDRMNYLGKLISKYDRVSRDVLCEQFSLLLCDYLLFENEFSNSALEYSISILEDTSLFYELSESIIGTCITHKLLENVSVILNMFVKRSLIEKNWSSLARVARLRDKLYIDSVKEMIDEDIVLLFLETYVCGDENDWSSFHTLLSVFLEVPTTKRLFEEWFQKVKKIREHRIIARLVVSRDMECHLEYLQEVGCFKAICDVWNDQILTRTLDEEFFHNLLSEISKRQNGVISGVICDFGNLTRDNISKDYTLPVTVLLSSISEQFVTENSSFVLHFLKFSFSMMMNTDDRDGLQALQEEFSNVLCSLSPSSIRKAFVTFISEELKDILWRRTSEISNIYVLNDIVLDLHQHYSVDVIAPFIRELFCSDNIQPLVNGLLKGANFYVQDGDIVMTSCDIEDISPVLNTLLQCMNPFISGTIPLALKLNEWIVGVTFMSVGHLCCPQILSSQSSPLSKIMENFIKSKEESGSLEILEMIYGSLFSDFWKFSETTKSVTMLLVLESFEGILEKRHFNELLNGLIEVTFERKEDFLKSENICRCRVLKWFFESKSDVCGFNSEIEGIVGEMYVDVSEQLLSVMGMKDVDVITQLLPCYTSLIHICVKCTGLDFSSDMNIIREVLSFALSCETSSSLFLEEVLSFVVALVTFFPSTMINDSGILYTLAAFFMTVYSQFNGRLVLPSILSLLQAVKTSSDCDDIIEELSEMMDTVSDRIDSCLFKCGSCDVINDREITSCARIALLFPEKLMFSGDKIPKFSDIRHVLFHSSHSIRCLGHDILLEILRKSSESWNLETSSFHDYREITFLSNEICSILQAEGEFEGIVASEKLTTKSKRSFFLFDNDQSVLDTKWRLFSIYLLVWNSLLRFISEIEDTSLRSDIIDEVKSVNMFGKLLSSLFLCISHLGIDERRWIPLQEEVSCSTITGLDTCTPHFVSITAASMLRSAVLMFPAATRAWALEADRESSYSIEKYFLHSISPLLIERELKGVMSYSEEMNSLTMRASSSSKCVLAEYEKDDVRLEVEVTIPHSYPLRNIQVSSDRHVGVSKGKWKTWVFQMMGTMFSQNGTLVDALLLWSSNLDRHFEGVGKCVICLCIVHTSNRTLPTFSCPTCKQTFHASCLHKWFVSSQKTTCPVCRGKI